MERSPSTSQILLSFHQIPFHCHQCQSSKWGPGDINKATPLCSLLEVTGADLQTYNSIFPKALRVFTEEKREREIRKLYIKLWQTWWNTAISYTFLLWVWLKKHGEIENDAFKMNKGEQRNSNVQSAHKNDKEGKLGLRSTCGIKKLKL